MDPINLTRDETPTHLINPLDKELQIEIFNDANQRVMHVIPPMKVMTYPKWLADILRKHVVDAMVNARNPKFGTPELRAEYAKETEVENL